MAMQVGLLHDQNRILQRVAKDAAGEDFTSLIDAVVRGMSAAR
ncbi:hypothetical protein [Massilia timonae]|nr:hypothetical protein [Massilia timonae]